jgi:translation initiation factor IF-2
MGHVDHGKTSLLDAIRETNVVESEAGGITQHIGAYEVKTAKGDIVFLDTPGHEAFTAMRAHGSKITDIVVLIVAADDGVMPQTLEAINHARVAGVPIIAAINKIDLPGAKVEKVRQQLANYNLISDEWGGDTFTVEISAKNKINLDKLLETILFKAELMELKTNPNCPAQGIVIESKLDSRKGPIATVLIQKGVLNIGNSFICSITYGKVKALTNDRKERISKANSNIPVEILGFDSVPFVGDKFMVVKDDSVAREIIQKRQAIFRQERLQVNRKISLEDIAAGKLKQLNIVLKADVQGSLDAIRDALGRISSDKVKLNIVHFGVGAISMSDVNLAISSDAIIIGFNIRPNPDSEVLAKQEGVDIRVYRVIYELIDEIKHALEGMLPPKFKEVTIGKVQVRKVFQISRVGAVAGCFVTAGKVQRSAHVRLLRDNVIVYDGTIATLRRFKDDVKEVEKGYECGIMLSDYNDIKINDVIEVYIQEKVEQKLD